MAKKKEATVQPKTEQQRMDEFTEKYKTLCEEYGLRVVVTPVWTARDDGTWSLVLQTAVGKLPEKK